MPTAENIFPKIGGDPLYFSEANRFSRAGQFIAMGSFAQLTSGTTAGSVIGSIIISGANQTQRYVELDIWARASRGNNIQSIGVAFSGGGLGELISDNFVVGSGLSSDIAGTNNMVIHSYINIGSIHSGYGYMRAQHIGLANQDVGRQDNQEKISTFAFNSFNTGSPYIIQFFIPAGTGSGAAANYNMSYSIQGCRGNLLP